MKLIANILDKEIEVKLEKTDSKVIAWLDGREYELEASEPESSIYLLKHENRIFEIFVSPIEGELENLSTKLDGDEFEIKLVDPKRLRGTGAQAGSADGILELRTAMPGKVVKVLVEEGTQVEQGVGVVIVEAMKMQNEMKTTKDGVVKEIRFGEGETVNAGDVLAVIE